MNKEIIIEGLIEQVFNAGSERVKRDAAVIVCGWYENEGAFEDFENEQEFLNYVQSDIRNMLDAATDPDEINTVSAVL